MDEKERIDLEGLAKALGPALESNMESILRPMRIALGEMARAAQEAAHDAAEREFVRGLWRIKLTQEGRTESFIAAELAEGRVSDSFDSWYSIAAHILARQYGGKPTDHCELTARQVVNLVEEIERELDREKRDEAMQANTLEVAKVEAPELPEATAQTGPERHKPLPDKQRRVLEILQSLPPGEGLTGKQILIKLADGTEQSTLTKHIIPGLKKAGYSVENRLGAGYYLAH